MTTRLRFALAAALCAGLLIIGVVRRLIAPRGQPPDTFTVARQPDLGPERILPALWPRPSTRCQATSLVHSGATVTMRTECTDRGYQHPKFGGDEEDSAIIMRDNGVSLRGVIATGTIDLYCKPDRLQHADLGHMNIDLNAEYYSWRRRMGLDPEPHEREGIYLHDSTVIGSMSSDNPDDDDDIPDAPGYHRIENRSQWPRRPRP